MIESFGSKGIFLEDMEWGKLKEEKRGKEGVGHVMQVRRARTAGRYKYGGRMILTSDLRQISI